jgi:hypothetical protein
MSRYPLKIIREYNVGGEHEYERVHFERRDGGWFVSTEAIDGKGWRPYADAQARPTDVRQLLRKEYDVSY